VSIRGKRLAVFFALTAALIALIFFWVLSKCDGASFRRRYDLRRRGPTPDEPSTWTSSSTSRRASKSPTRSSRARNFFKLYHYPMAGKKEKLLRLLVEPLGE
jgi:hypothetical protein